MRPLDGGRDGGDAGIDGQSSLDPQLPAFCLPDGSFPDAGGAVSPELSTTPAVKWAKKLVNYVGGKRLVMSKEAVAVSLSNGLAIHDKSSGEVHAFLRFGGELFDDVVVARDGTFLLAGGSLYAVDHRGELVWSTRLASRPPARSEWAGCNIAYSARRQLLISVCNDGTMSGIDVASRGTPQWGATVYMTGWPDISLMPSIGDVALMWFPKGYQPAGTVALDPATGKKLGVFGGSDDGASSVSSHGFLGRRSFDSRVLLDGCGQPRWLAREGNQLPMIVGGPDERVFMVEFDGDGGSKLGMIAPSDGRRLAGPTASGTPVEAGADGTYYAVSCGSFVHDTTSTPPELVAYDADLTEKWRLTLPVPSTPYGYWCPLATVALDDDGTMYLAVEADGTYLLAVQTRSPGLADTAWPLVNHDNSGSRWLD